MISSEGEVVKFSTTYKVRQQNGVEFWLKEFQKLMKRNLKKIIKEAHS